MVVARAAACAERRGSCYVMSYCGLRLTSDSRSRRRPSFWPTKLSSIEDEVDAASLVAAAHFLLARHASLWLHELAHAAAALLAGAKVTAVRVPLVGGNSHTSTAGVGRAEAFVRHAGWICSVYVAVLAARTLTLPCAVAALLVAAEAVVSDLFAIERYRCSAGTFYCGNFGIIVLDRAAPRAGCCAR